MSDHNDNEALETAKDLTGALTEMAAEVKRLRTYGRRNRWFIWFDVALTILLTAVGGVAFRAVQSAHDANVSATEARAVAAVATQNNRNLCESSNVARAQQINLWSYLFGLAGPPKTAQGVKLTAEFEHHLHVVFAPRDCSHPDAKTP